MTTPPRSPRAAPGIHLAFYSHAFTYDSLALSGMSRSSNRAVTTSHGAAVGNEACIFLGFECVCLSCTFHPLSGRGNGVFSNRYDPLHNIMPFPSLSHFSLQVVPMLQKASCHHSLRPREFVAIVH